MTSSHISLDKSVSQVSPILCLLLIDKTDQNIKSCYMGYWFTDTESLGLNDFKYLPLPGAILKQYDWVIPVD